MRRQHRADTSGSRRPEDNKYFYVAWDEFDRTVKALEQSMGMVLR